jgi:hypothetical protein
MKPVFRMAGRCRGRAATAICGLLLTATASPVRAAGCAFEAQGEGRVAAVIDARSFRLEDGREILLAGIEPVASDKAALNRASALSAMLTGREVTLRGEDDTPDRYGREPAFVFLVPSKAAPAETSPSEILVQEELLAQGEALVSATVADKECAAVLTAAEAAARQAWHLGRSRRHKKPRKSGRYFGRDWAFYGGRGQGSVRPAGGGNDLPEFRTELDTGFRCDYFKAGASCFRGCRYGA